MATVKLSDTQKIDISSFKNETGKFMNIRKFYKTKNSDDWLPTKQGLTLPEEKAAKFIKAFRAELESIEENAVELVPKGKEDSKPKKKGKARD